MSRERGLCAPELNQQAEEAGVARLVVFHGIPVEPVEVRIVAVRVVIAFLHLRPIPYVSQSPAVGDGTGQNSHGSCRLWLKQKKKGIHDTLGWGGGFEPLPVYTLPVVHRVLRPQQQQLRALLKRLIQARNGGNYQA